MQKEPDIEMYYMYFVKVSTSSVAQHPHIVPLPAGSPTHRDTKPPGHQDQQRRAAAITESY